MRVKASRSRAAAMMRRFSRPVRWPWKRGSSTIAPVRATASIGAQALEIVRDSPDLRVVALAARSSTDELLAAALEHGVDLLALTEPGAAAAAREAFSCTVLSGRDGLLELVRSAEADVV